MAASAQNCQNLPAVPDNTVTSTQDRDHMMCELGIVFPTLPVRQGTEWPWNDPTAPTNAWPKSQANPEGNWTDAQGHTIVRTAWGNWHTYDSETVFEPPADLHYPNVAATYKGGAMTGVGDYGPLSNPRYPDIELLEMKDGTPVELREDWWIKRRPQIFGFVQDQLYGKSLFDFRPNITWTVAPAVPASSIAARNSAWGSTSVTMSAMSPSAHTRSRLARPNLSLVTTSIVDSAREIIARLTAAAPDIMSFGPSTVRPDAPMMAMSAL
jgi:hypothetical protein